MSRIGNKPVILPAGVTVTVDVSRVVVKGPKGELSEAMPRGIKASVEEGKVVFSRDSEEGQIKANHGLIRSLTANMVEGVSVGFTKKLELVGTGYRAKKQGNGLTISAGYSHPVEYQAVDGVNLDTETETIIVVSGISKHDVGQAAAQIRAIRKPEPYQGKGIRYQGEYIRRKAGKAAKTGA